MAELQKLFNPQTIAVVGASEEEGKVGNVIAKNILGLGYQGQTFLVNPKHETLLGQRCYKSLAEIEGAVDLAIIVIPAKFVNQTIQAAAGKVKNFVVISAGFAEINEEGKQREKELAEIANANNLNILGPNCLGFIIPSLQLNASFAGGLPEAGNISFVSQSGALAVALMDVAKNNNLKFSSIISIGNKMQIDESELLEYLDQDENTKVIGMYLEGIKDGHRFMTAASRMKKPIVILKAGKTERAQKAISSHTGALAGSDEIMSEVFQKVGVIRAETIENFLNILQLISLSDAPSSEAAAIITNAGGLGVLTTDAFKDKKIKLAEISEKTKINLRKFLPEESSVANPIDVLGDADEKRYVKALATVEKDNPGSIICLLTPQDQTPVKKVAQKIAKFKEKSGRDVLTVFMGGKRVEKAIAKLHESGIPNFFIADQAVNALDKYYAWSLRKNGQIEEAKNMNEERKSEAAEIVRKAKSDGRGALSFAEARQLMGMYGIPTVETFLPDASEIKFPVAVKVDSDKVLHKTDKQGLILNIKNQEELRMAIKKIQDNFPGENFIIQPMQKINTELILGMKKDDIFGPVIVFGLGGIYTEVFKMVDFLVPPAGQEEIREKLESSRLKFLFQETRGQRAYVIDEMIGILEGISSLAQEIEEIKELDINPLLAYNDGTAAVAVDVKIVI